jgi:hypothetical protein
MDIVNYLVIIDGKLTLQGVPNAYSAAYEKSAKNSNNGKIGGQKSSENRRLASANATAYGQPTFERPIGQMAHHLVEQIKSEI